MKAVLNKKDFGEVIMNLLMEWVMIARYKISHAGKEFGNTNPSMGLCQGDPLSSYLFLICIKGFSALIKNYESRGMIRGIKVARGAPTVSHIFFTDDSYIYRRANMEESVQIMNLLATFEKASGQKIIVDKSNVFFCCNMVEEARKEVLEVMRFNTHYLGLRNCMGGNKSIILGYLKEKVSTRRL